MHPLSNNDAQSDESPWIVGVFWGGFFDPKNFICSGTLISDEHVLVSANCGIGVLNAKYFMYDHAEIRMGGHNVDAIRRNIIHVYKHENYEYFQKLYAHFPGLSNDFDIAILKMDRAVSFGSNLQPICLPQSSDFDYSGISATAIGLYDSTINIISPMTRTKARQTNIPIWTNEECAKIPDYAKYFTDNMICAGDYENGTHRARIRDVS